ncbi:MAG TPA: zf-TFIIB domain-containing protein [Kofleriaceae bacterium]|jgi:Zn-finger nucleic acid-binding protein
MSGPYRDADQYQCPACGEAMRAFYKRLCCDACTGIFIALDDLTAAIEQHASAAPVIAFRDHGAGERACPRCGKPMQTCRFEAMFNASSNAMPSPELDRCAAHGVWFDVGELAKILESSRHATEPDAGDVRIARVLVELWESGR